MRVVFGSIITEGHGKVGGNIIQKSYGGYQMRNIVQPLKNPKISQSVNRNKWAYLSKQWRTLTSSEQISWNTAAPSGKSGFELFIETNMPFVAQGNAYLPAYVAPVSNPPAQNLVFIQTDYLPDPPDTVFDFLISSPFQTIPQGDWIPYFLWTGWIPSSQYRFPPIKLRIPASAISGASSGIEVDMGAATGFNKTAPAAGSKAKISEAYINTVTGQIYNVATYLVTAENSFSPTNPYNPQLTLGTGIFTPGSPDNAFQQEFIATGDTIDFSIWEPWVWWNGWSLPGDPTTGILDQQIPDTAVTAVDDTHITINWNNSPGNGTPPPVINSNTQVMIGWRRVSDSFLEATPTLLVQASNH